MPQATLIAGTTVATLMHPDGMQKYEFRTTPRGRDAGLVTIVRWDPTPVSRNRWELDPAQVWTTEAENGRAWWRRLTAAGFTRIN